MFSDITQQCVCTDYSCKGILHSTPFSFSIIRMIQANARAHYRFLHPDCIRQKKEKQYEPTLLLPLILIKTFLPDSLAFKTHRVLVRDCPTQLSPLQMQKLRRRKVCVWCARTTRSWGSQQGTAKALSALTTVPTAPPHHLQHQALMAFSFFPTGEPPHPLSVLAVWYCDIVRRNIYLVFVSDSWHKAPKTPIISWVTGLKGASFIIIFSLHLQFLTQELLRPLETPEWWRLLYAHQTTGGWGPRVSFGMGLDPRKIKAG